MKTAVALALLVGGSAAQACTLSAWFASSGAVVPASPAGDTGDGAVTDVRFNGLCSMQLPAAGTGYVEDRSAAAEPRMIARYYFLPRGGTGSATIFTAFSDDAATTEVYNVSYDADANTVTVTVNGEGTTVSGGVNTSQWNYIEIDWDNGANQTRVWINQDSRSVAATGSTGSGSQTIVEAVRLGSPAGLGTVDAILYDDYESRRTTAIGNILAGDADGNGCRTLGDAILVLNEFLSGVPVNGAPDTDSNGTVTLGDAVQALNLFLGGDNTC